MHPNKAKIVVFFLFRLTADDFGLIKSQMHCKGRIWISRFRDLFFDCQFNIQLFPAFPDQAIGQRFPRFLFTAGELPKQRAILTLRPLANENFAFFIVNQSGSYFQHCSFPQFLNRFPRQLIAAVIFCTIRMPLHFVPIYFMPACLSEQALP